MKMDNENTNDCYVKILAAANSTFAIGWVSRFADSLVVAESFVLRINISAENPRLRKAANRCAIF